MSTLFILIFSVLVVALFTYDFKKDHKKNHVEKDADTLERGDTANHYGIMKIVKRVDEKIHGPETKLEGEPTKLLSSWIVEVYDGDGRLFKQAPVRFNKKDNRFSIGRHPGNDLVIPVKCPGADYLGKFHAYLTKEEDILYFHDNNSENGSTDVDEQWISWSDIQDNSEFYLAGIIRVRFLKTSPAEYFRRTKKVSKDKAAIDPTQQQSIKGVHQGLDKRISADTHTQTKLAARKTKIYSGI